MNTEILKWDSEFFGFKTARIHAPELNETQLDKCLRNLRSREVRLVYWAATKPVEYDVNVFGGKLVDQKAVFTIDLQKGTGIPSPDGVEVSPYSPEIPQQVMYDLALQAGVLSRYARDPQFPQERFEALYLEWIRKSLNGELADQVLVAVTLDIPAGMVTLSAREKTGSIGLIAVDTAFRGRHIGLALMAAAHNWYRKKKLNLAHVVTQADNQPACRLYQRCGYQMSSLEYFYHFWL